MVPPSGMATLKFWKKPAVHRNNMFRAKVSPAHNLFPAPNGSEWSFLKHKLPSSPMNRSGAKRSGWSQVSLSWLAASKAVIIKLPCWMNKEIIKSDNSNFERSIYFYLRNVITQEFCIFQCPVRQTRWHQCFISHYFANTCFGVWKTGKQTIPQYIQSDYDRKREKKNYSMEKFAIRPT